mmetsp:Transcript_29417/g.49660  ORF Transcript_29417/g.49660 Transcript_29417/m.49660 type:complete len:225 (+) Transcript_29417:1-675(+)
MTRIAMDMDAEVKEATGEGGNDDGSSTSNVVQRIDDIEVDVEGVKGIVDELNEKFEELEFRMKPEKVTITGRSEVLPDKDLAQRGAFNNLEEKLRERFPGIINATSTASCDEERMIQLLRSLGDGITFEEPYEIEFSRRSSSVGSRKLYNTCKRVSKGADSCTTPSNFVAPLIGPAVTTGVSKAANGLGLLVAKKGHVCTIKVTLCCITSPGKRQRRNDFSSDC